MINKWITMPTVRRSSALLSPFYAMNSVRQFGINKPVASAGVQPWIVSVYCSQTSSTNSKWINFSSLGVGCTVLWLQPSSHLWIILDQRYLSSRCRKTTLIPDTTTTVVVEGEEVSGLYFSVEVSHVICWNSPTLTASLAACIPLPLKLRSPRLHLDQQCVGATQCTFMPPSNLVPSVAICTFT